MAAPVEDRIAWANKMRLLARCALAVLGAGFWRQLACAPLTHARRSQLCPKGSVNEDGSIRQEFFKPKKARARAARASLSAGRVRQASVCWSAANAAHAPLLAQVIFVADKKWGDAERDKLYEARPCCVLRPLPYSPDAVALALTLPHAARHTGPGDAGRRLLARDPHHAAA
jgi:hypothetical protein